MDLEILFFRKLLNMNSILLILAAHSFWVSFGSLWFLRNWSISFIVKFRCVELKTKKRVFNFPGDFQFVAYNPYSESSVTGIKTVNLSPHALCWS